MAELVPVFSSCAGTARWPYSSSSSPIAPSTALIANGRDGEGRRPVHRLGERLRELGVGDGRRPGEVDRAATLSCSSACRMPPTSSSSEIHGMYWVPGPSRPPRKT